MSTTMRKGLLAFVGGMLVALVFFFSRQESGFNLYASVLGGPGLQQQAITYDVSVHADDDQMWVISHRDMSTVEELSLLLLYDDVEVSIQDEGVTSKREDGILELNVTDPSQYGVGDEIARWSFDGDAYDIVLSDVTVSLAGTDDQTLSVFNTMTCLGPDCRQQ